MSLVINRWTCDVCGEPIHGAADGYVIWKTDDRLRAYGFKLIHKSRCDRIDHTSSYALADLTGPDGLSYLLSFLSVGPIKAALGQRCPPRVSNFDEFVDLLRRLHVPFYDAARPLFHSAGVLEEEANSTESAPYRVEALELMLSSVDAGV